MDDPQSLKVIETALAQHRAFGRSDYINQQLEKCYHRHLNNLSASLPVAGQLLHSLCHATPESRYHLIGDTVVRCAIQHAVIQSETGTQYGLPANECEDVFRATVRHIEEVKCGGPAILRGLLESISRFTSSLCCFLSGLRSVIFRLVDLQRHDKACFLFFYSLAAFYYTNLGTR